MITGWVLAFFAGVVTGVLGRRAELPPMLLLFCGFAMGMGIVKVCIEAGLP